MLWLLQFFWFNFYRTTGSDGSRNLPRLLNIYIRITVDIAEKRESRCILSQLCHAVKQLKYHIYYKKKLEEGLLFTEGEVSISPMVGSRNYLWIFILIFPYADFSFTCTNLWQFHPRTKKMLNILTPLSLCCRHDRRC